MPALHDSTVQALIALRDNARCNLAINAELPEEVLAEECAIASECEAVRVSPDTETLGRMHYAKEELRRLSVEMEDHAVASFHPYHRGRLRASVFVIRADLDMASDAIPRR